MSRNDRKDRVARECRQPPADGPRLQLYLARCGLGSRRSCEGLVAGGHVKVNGAVVTHPGTRVAVGDAVAVDGRAVSPVDTRVYLAVYKPRECLCAASDPAHRPLVQDLFSGVVHERLFHVGRLDYLSTGLILYTNDGEFSRAVSHPGSGIEKEYLVESGRDIDEEMMRRYARGIRVGDVTYRCLRYVMKGPRSVLVTLTEGKNREIRNVFASRNIRLKRVHRLRIGPVTLRGLAPGRFRRLTAREVAWFAARRARPAAPAPPASRSASRGSRTRAPGRAPGRW